MAVNLSSRFEVVTEFALPSGRRLAVVDVPLVPLGLGPEVSTIEVGLHLLHELLGQSQRRELVWVDADSRVKVSEQDDHHCEDQVIPESITLVEDTAC